MVVNAMSGLLFFSLGFISHVAFLDGLLKFAHIEAALSKYDSQRAIELAQSLVECHRSSPLGLLSLARAYFEQANYHKVL